MKQLPNASEVPFLECEFGHRKARPTRRGTHKPLAPGLIRQWGGATAAEHHLQDMTRRNISLAEMNT